MSDETCASAPATEVCVVVSSRVREVVKAKGLRSDGKLAEALSAKVLAMLDRACERAKAEGRATVRPADLESA